MNGSCKQKQRTVFVSFSAIFCTSLRFRATAFVSKDTTANTHKRGDPVGKMSSGARKARNFRRKTDDDEEEEEGTLQVPKIASNNTFYFPNNR